MTKLIEIRKYLETEIGLTVQWKQFAQCNALFIHWHISCHEWAISMKRFISPRLKENFEITLAEFGEYVWIIITKKNCK